MRIAFVHDWLVTYAGAERVLEQMLRCFPTGDVYSVIDFLSRDKREFILNKPVTTSFVQKMPFSRKLYRSYLPAMLLAVEQFDLRQYDIVISSSHAVAKGVLTGPDQLHICMCYSPIRYAWDLQQQYLTESGLSTGIRGFIAKWMLHYVRLWDSRTANGVDQFIAISRFIARRIRKTYRRDSVVIYPPVDISRFVPGKIREDFYVVASRLVPYKRIDLIVRAFAAMPTRKLIVIGTGPELKKITKIATANVFILGEQPYDVLLSHLQRARAFVFAAEEDFGIAPIEAQACGTPVIAYGKGGVLETIQGDIRKPNPTGLFFDEQSADAITRAVQQFEEVPDAIRPEACRENALRFSPERFRQEFADCLLSAWEAHIEATQ